MTTQSSQGTTDDYPRHRKIIFGQPGPLFNIFSVELWERFSFYGMQAVATIYLYTSLADGGLGLDKPIALGIIGAYGGGVYVCTVLGSWVADRILGPERVLFIGAMIIMAGHIALAVIPEGAGLAIGFVLVAIGSGGLKATATTVVGMLYPPGDNRRDAGFSIFYMGINIGAFFGPIMTGSARAAFGFHWAFGLAAIGMGLGLLQYSLTRKNLPDEARVVSDPLKPAEYSKYIAIGIGTLILAIGLALLFVVGTLSLKVIPYIMLSIAGAGSIAYFTVILKSSKITDDERSRVVAFIPMFLASVAFWALFQQQFTFIIDYADTKLDRNLFGWEMPVEWVNSINPVFIIIFAGVFAGVWTKMGSRQPPAPIKFSVGMVIMGIAYFCFIPFANQGDGSVPLLVLVGVLFLFTIAELLLSPVGLSLTTKLSPAAFRAQMVALFFLSVSMGTTLAGIFSQMYNAEDEMPYFVWTGVIAISVGVLLALANKPILKLMRGVR